MQYLGENYTRKNKMKEKTSMYTKHIAKTTHNTNYYK